MKMTPIIIGEPLAKTTVTTKFRTLFEFVVISSLGLLIVLVSCSVMVSILLPSLVQQKLLNRGDRVDPVDLSEPQIREEFIKLCQQAQKTYQCIENWLVKFDVADAAKNGTLATAKERKETLMEIHFTEYQQRTSPWKSLQNILLGLK